MTAEVAVLNRYAVALAADSAVTVSNGGGTGKIYNAANKLFALSKREPVGIMVYGNAEFMGVPWETIIKVYRAKLGSRFFPKLADYYNDFLRFLGSNDDMFGPETQETYVEDTAGALFQTVRQQVRNAIDVATKSKTSGLTEDDIASVRSAAIAAGHSRFGKPRLLKGFDADHEALVGLRYRDAIDRTMATIFERLPLSDEDKAQLREMVVFSLTRDVFPNSAPGIVIAGFGRKEHFPMLESATIQARVANRLKFRPYVSADVAKDKATVIPFAQTDAVMHFVEGIDPNHALEATKLVKGALDGLKDDILNSLEFTDDDRKVAADEWEKKARERLRAFSEAAVASRSEKYVSPLMQVIAVLPKDELASVAEALVNLTSLRRKMTMGEETVGGPIDVAVISKGDGLIWMKRKHYFRPELNPHFVENYFRENTEEDHHGEDER